LFVNYNLNFEECNIKLEMYFQDLSNGVLQSPKFQTFQLGDQKINYALKFLSSRCHALIDETCVSKFKGQGMEEMACPVGYNRI
jgi:hypothetical protein